MKLAVLTFLLITFSSSSMAQNENLSFYIAGVGYNSKCSHVNNLNSELSRVAYVQWIAGLITGMNLANSSKQLEIKLISNDPAEIFKEARKYCLDNPDEVLAQAVFMTSIKRTGQP